MKRYLWLWLCLAACSQYSDGRFLAIDPLSPPVSRSLGIPLRVTAAGGKCVQIEVLQGKLEDGTAYDCLTIAGSTAAVVVVHPNVTEAVVVGRLYSSCDDPSKTSCGDMNQAVLAEVETSVRLQDANPPGDAGSGSAGSGSGGGTP